MKVNKKLLKKRLTLPAVFPYNKCVNMFYNVLDM